MSEKIYVGSGKKINGKYGEFRNATLNLNKLKEHAYEFKGDMFVNVTINDKSEPDQYGKDVSVTINQYKKQDTEKQETENRVSYQKNEDYDLPF